MAEVGRVLCARGFPFELEPERVADKLQIHFLRARNGGVETSVTVKAREQLAIITFEDSRDVHSVLSHCPHILEVDGSKYKLCLSFPWQEPLYLNKVILDMSMTLDFSLLPLGEESVKTLCEKYPGLSVNFIRSQRQCSLHGHYSEIQAVVSDLTQLFKDFDPVEEQHSFIGNVRTQGLERSQSTLENQDESRPTYQPQQFHGRGPQSFYQEAKHSEILLQKDLRMVGNSVDLSQTHTHSAKERKEWLEEASVEAFSLIMEADVFKYLCTKSEEYKHILQKHKVQVVDVTSNGVTTLYLQFDAKDTTWSGTEKHMEEARKELSKLYQQVEGNLRRAELQKTSLNLRKGHTAAFKELQSILPKVMLSYDDTKVYIVGESSEVSQAKQILLLGSTLNQELSLASKKESAPALPFPSNSYSAASELESTQENGTSIVAAPKMHISGTERKGRSRDEYRLAARFKSTEMGLLGLSSGERGRGKVIQEFNTSTNIPALATNYAPKPPSRSSLDPGGTVSSNQDKKSAVSSFKATSAVHTEEILSQNMDSPSFALMSTASGSVLTKVPNLGSIGSTSTLTPTVKATPSISVNTISGLDKQIKSPIVSASQMASYPVSPLKRSNSFSGRHLQKQETQKTGKSERTGLSVNTNHDPARSVRRPRSNSLSNGKPAEVHPGTIVAREVTVSTVMWNYMKEAYHSRLNALISDIDMSESSADKTKVKVILKGPDLTKVSECQNELQRLVGMVHSDFCVEKLQLADLGVTKDNEELLTCCSKIHSQFSKLSLQVVNDTVILIGPKPLCSNASKMIKEECSGSVSVSPVSAFLYQRTVNQDSVSAYHIPFQAHHQNRPYQTILKTPSPEGSSTDQLHKDKSYKPEASNVMLAKQKVVVKEKVKGESRRLETSQTDILFNKSSESIGMVGTRDYLNSSLDGRTSDHSRNRQK